MAWIIPKESSRFIILIHYILFGKVLSKNNIPTVPKCNIPQLLNISHPRKKKSSRDHGTHLVGEWGNGIGGVLAEYWSNIFQFKVYFEMA